MAGKKRRNRVRGRKDLREKSGKKEEGRERRNRKRGKKDRQLDG